MRTWGRVGGVKGVGGTWVEVDTDPNGSNALVYLTTLCQVLLLNLNEDPFFANYGIPAQQSVMQQIYPDFYMIATQQQFAQYFASLIITRQPRVPNSQDLVYNVAVTTPQGVVLNKTVQIPT